MAMRDPKEWAKEMAPHFESSHTTKDYAVYVGCIVGATTTWRR